MSAAATQHHDTHNRPLNVALVGAPNCGKTTLFNGLTGSNGKVANYAGATVEIRIAGFTTPNNHNINLIDLPGFYGMTPRSKDEKVAVNAIDGGMSGTQPDIILVLMDALNIRTHLHSVLQLKDHLAAQYGDNAPLMMLSLNMIDLARHHGIDLDLVVLQQALNMPVVTSQAPRKKGRVALLAMLDHMIEEHKDDFVHDIISKTSGDKSVQHDVVEIAVEIKEIKTYQQQARKITNAAIKGEAVFSKATRVADKIFIHPILGPIILLSILFFMFQAVFSWSAWPMDNLEALIGWIGESVAAGLDRLLGEGAWFTSLVTDGVIAGVGSVLVFLPQILILFFFILILEATGYMARAAYMMDELMRKVGLNGRAFIPLLSSFACAIPGIMAARVIESERDRLTTIMIAPLMTCSARLPVYAILIGAFVPAKSVGFFNQQGLVLFGLYMAGIISAILVSFVMKKTITKGVTHPLLMEMPSYKVPRIQDILFGLWGRSKGFLKRAGTIIFATSVALWFLASYTFSKGNIVANASNLRESYAGIIGGWIEPIFAPIGFNLEMVIALIPGMAAREVAVGALGTVYAVSNPDDNEQGMIEMLQNEWTLPMALSFMTWYVFAPQCFATLATIRRETNSWGWMGFAFTYLMAMAYLASLATFHIASLF